MALEFKKARRSQARIKICMGGASGSGKTMSSLLLAYGLIKAEHPELTDAECWDKICIIDTENGSGGLYVNTPVGSSWSLSSVSFMICFRWKYRSAESPGWMVKPCSAGIITSAKSVRSPL